MIMQNGVVNGKRVNLPASATRDDVIRAYGRNVDPGSRAVTRISRNGNERLKPGQTYQVKAGDKFKIGPDRVKGAGETYFGHKDDWRKQLIIDQVSELSQKFFKNGKVELDDDCNWVTFDNFKLPESWQQANPDTVFVKMMLVFPDAYPELPTNGFYLPSTIKPPAADRHFFERGYSGAFGGSTEEMQALAGAGWKWYCTHIKPNAWRPAHIQRIGDWRNGDNLWHIITLCEEVLTNPYDD